MNKPLFIGSGFPLDRLGAIASCVSALHCALCALAPILLILAGLGVLVRQMVEWTFALLPVTLLTRGSAAATTKKRAEAGVCFRSGPRLCLWFCSGRTCASLVRRRMERALAGFGVHCVLPKERGTEVIPGKGVMAMLHAKSRRWNPRSYFNDGATKR